MMIWIGVSFLAVIAILLLILIGLVKKLINIVQDIRMIRPAAEEGQLIETSTPAIPEEDLAVIMAVMVKMLPGVNLADVEIKAV